MGIIARPLLERLQEKYRVNDITGCWEWTASIKRNGYGQIGIPGPKPTMLDAHRASWIVHNGPIPHKMLVLHTCDVKTCVNPAHLWLGTQRNNMQDCLRKGRFDRVKKLRGESHYAARLTWDQVEAIRADTRRQIDIAADYGIRQGYVSGIKLYKKWRSKE
jgi:hypothetical protein